MSKTTQKSPQYYYYYFNYADVLLEGYADNKKNSSQLLKEIIHKLNDQNFLKGKRVIDRHENRTGSEKRLLVHISAPFEKGGGRVFGKIALIKNKSVFMLSGTDLIEQIEKPENKEFIEITNYSITFEPKPIIMVEFNSEGPRLSDIEFYFRQISKDARIAKSIKTRFHLNVDYNKLSQKINNVFYVEVKVKANELYKSGDVNWHKGLKQLNDDVRYKDVRLEFFYPRIKDVKKGGLLRNVTGLKFARNIIDWLKGEPGNIEYIDDLKMNYVLEGSDKEINLDFIKNKTTSVLSIPIGNVNKRIEFNYDVGIEFSTYIQKGTTTEEKKE
ncbi:MAG: hypothetical protein ACXVP0_04120 [Bacteroidia bacterium]